MIKSCAFVAIAVAMHVSHSVDATMGNFNARHLLISSFVWPENRFHPRNLLSNGRSLSIESSSISLQDSFASLAAVFRMVRVVNRIAK